MDDLDAVQVSLVDLVVRGAGLHLREKKTTSEEEGATRGSRRRNFPVVTVETCCRPSPSKKLACSPGRTSVSSFFFSGSFISAFSSSSSPAS